MKNIQFLLLIVLVVPHLLICTDNEIISIERTTHLTFRRYYFIARLERTIKLLSRINQSRQKSKCTTSIRFEPNSFKHKRVHQAAIRINQSKSIKPIFAVWDEFSSYKSLESELVIGKDDLFVKEFGQQLFFITKNLFAETKHADILRQYNEEHIDALSAEQILDLLDSTVDLIEKKRRYMPKISKFSDIRVHATTDEINLRFYYIERLKPCIELLESIKTNRPKLLNRIVASVKSDLRTIVSPHKSNSLQGIVREMIHSESAEPMFRSWQDFRQYRKINDETFPKDLCMIIFAISKQLYNTANSSHASHSSIIEITEIEDILYAIDLISEEIQGCVELYEKEDTTISEWLKKKWWIPVVAASTVSLKLLLHYLQKVPTQG